jgi:uncharacterized membrane protein YgcG
MRCPLCHAPLQEHSPCCPQCHFELQQADRDFGIPPPLGVPLTDLARALTRRQFRLALKGLEAFTRRFPQMFFHVVAANLPKEQNLAATVFWLFNKGGICTPMEDGGYCHDVLLLLDIDHARAACIIGYGLEPFVTPESLDEICQAALPSLREKQYLQAIQEALAKADEVLSAASATARQAYGLNPNDVQPNPIHEQAFAY